MGHICPSGAKRVKLLLTVLTILLVFEELVNTCNIPNPFFEKQLQTCTFDGCVILHAISFLVGPNDTATYQQRAFVKKITFSQSQLVCPPTLVIRFSVCFRERRGFFNLSRDTCSSSKFWTTVSQVKMLPITLWYRLYL